MTFPLKMQLLDFFSHNKSHLLESLALCTLFSAISLKKKNHALFSNKYIIFIQKTIL